MDQSGKAIRGSRRAQMALAVAVAGVMGGGIWFWAQDRVLPAGGSAQADQPGSPDMLPPDVSVMPTADRPEKDTALAAMTSAQEQDAENTSSDDSPLAEAVDEPLAAAPSETAGLIAENTSPLPDDPPTDAPGDMLAAMPPESPRPDVIVQEAAPEVGAPAGDAVETPGAALAALSALPEPPENLALSTETTDAVTPAPVFDLVRVDADGAGLVAGRAAPGAAVGVMLDGAELAEVRADPSGNFVAMFDVAPSDAARVLSLAARGDGAARISDSSVILAPRMAPAPDLVETAPASDAPPAPDLLVADADGVRMLPRAADGPLGPDQVTMDVIAYDAEGGVAVAGRAASGGVVRVYLDNAPLVDADVAGDGHWQVELPEVASGDHTLRIDHLTETGAVAARLETPFRREPPELLAALAPEGGDTPVSRMTVQPGNTLWGIARENYGAGMLYVKVFDANRTAIRDPDLIYPGQVFTLPE